MTQAAATASPTATTPLIGAGFRPELPGLFYGPDGPDVDVAELIADRYFAEGGFNRAWELAKLRDSGIPLLVHGLSGNTASALGPTDDYLADIKHLCDGINAYAYSDHLALTATDELALGHLAPNRFDDELLEYCSANIDRIVAATGRRVRLENLATTIQLEGSTYTVEEFYLELIKVNANWDCLVDLTNLWINAQNRELDPLWFIDNVPPDRLRYIHLAGGELHRGEWIDMHSQPVHEGAFELLEYTLARAIPDVIIIERDDNFADAEAQVRSDLARVRNIVEQSKLLVAAR